MEDMSYKGKAGLIVITVTAIITACSKILLYCTKNQKKQNMIQCLIDNGVIKSSQTIKLNEISKMKHVILSLLVNKKVNKNVLKSLKELNFVSGNDSVTQNGRKFLYVSFIKKY